MYIYIYIHGGDKQKQRKFLTLFLTSQIRIRLFVESSFGSDPDLNLDLIFSSALPQFKLLEAGMLNNRFNLKKLYYNISLVINLLLEILP